MDSFRKGEKWVAQDNRKRNTLEITLAAVVHGLWVSFLHAVEQFWLLIPGNSAVIT